MLDLPYLREALSTHSALVWSMLLVYMQDVDSKPVSLLKGSFTEVTRELSVPLIHTPGVLEMFVTVVLVCKDLSTSVAVVTSRF